MFYGLRPLSATSPSDRELIRAAKARGDTDVVLPSLSRPPRTLFVTEITTDPANFRNHCFAEYHGFRSIRLGSPG